MHCIYIPDCSGFLSTIPCTLDMYIHFHNYTHVRSTKFSRYVDWQHSQINGRLSENVLWLRFCCNSWKPQTFCPSKMWHSTVFKKQILPLQLSVQWPMAALCPTINCAILGDRVGYVHVVSQSKSEATVEYALPPYLWFQLLWLNRASCADNATIHVYLSCIIMGISLAC